AAPVLVFTTEEVWKYLPRVSGDPESVHMSLFPAEEALVGGLSGSVAEKWARLSEVRSAVLAALEQARAAKTIGGGLEAKIHLHASAEAEALQKLLEEKASDLPALFIVSQVVVDAEASEGALQSEILPGLSIKIERADGKKCDRCWNYSTHV